MCHPILVVSGITMALSAALDRLAVVQSNFDSTWDGFQSTNVYIMHEWLAKNHMYMHTRAVGRGAANVHENMTNCLNIRLSIWLFLGSILKTVNRYI